MLSNLKNKVIGWSVTRDSTEISFAINFYNFSTFGEFMKLEDEKTWTNKKKVSHQARRKRKQKSKTRKTSHLRADNCNKLGKVFFVSKVDWQPLPLLRILNQFVCKITCVEKDNRTKMTWSVSQKVTFLFQRVRHGQTEKLQSPSRPLWDT